MMDCFIPSSEYIDIGGNDSCIAAFSQVSLSLVTLCPANSLGLKWRGTLAWAASCCS